ncbi:site-specific integrase [Nocardioides eburneiflavus]|uniref:Site-specific integrase n=1 Tax=Nocardioides eburneiflavus TaxID=2518372 RepID=A0A4Z1CHZ0_9ACTN|nr:site-specific integrase [Nocardioides eburneiflavus]TGN65387.1 site-specific integrase [Nocardioides eburneiflavus]
MASVHKKPGRKKKDGTLGKSAWVVMWTDPSGKQKSKSFEKKAHASQFRATVEADMARGSYIDPKRGRVVFADYAAEWVRRRAKKGAANTRHANAARLRNHVTPYFEHLTLDRIDDDAVLDWLEGIAHLAPTTQRGIWTVMNSVMLSAVEGGLIAKNPLAKRTLHTAPIVKTRIVPWKHEWVTGMAETINERYRLAVVLAAGLGLRQGECFGLSPDDVDWLKGTVRIRRQVLLILEDGSLAFGPPKREKTRDVPLPESVKVEMNRHMAKYPPQTVTLPWKDTGGKPHAARLFLSTREHNPCNKNTFNEHTWRPARKVLDIPDRGPDGHRNSMHQLRHFYVSVLLDSGEPINAVAEHIGHDDMGYMLETYAHLMPAANERTKAAIDGAFEAASWTNFGQESSVEGEKGL